MRSYVRFFINGKEHKVSGVNATLTLTNYLRYSANLRGTKIVCSEGDCGACTVLVGKLGQSNSYKSVNSCILLVALLDGHHIITIEGIKVDDVLHEVQQAMVKNNGAQCGFCTPGIVMSLLDLFENKRNITEKDCRNYLTGNLCRCTGYGPILDAALSVDQNNCPNLNTLYPNIDKVISHDSFKITSDHLDIYSPNTLDDALKLKKEHPDIKIISSATDIGVQINKEVLFPRRFLSLEKIEDLHNISESDTEVSIGCRVSLKELEDFYQLIDIEFSSFLHLFASPQIKNIATLVGNIANSSPIGDNLPFLAVMNAKIILLGSSGEREVNYNDFCKSYKVIDLKPDEIIYKVIIPKRTKAHQLKLFKVSKRKDLDISCVNSAILMEPEEDKIKSIKIAFGGVGPTVLRLPKLEASLVGKSFNAKTFKEASHKIKNEITPMSDVRGSSEYRHLVAKNLFQRFFLESKKDLGL